MNLEDRLKELKEEGNEAPDCMEDRLRGSLEGAKRDNYNRGRKVFIKVATILIAILLIFNFDLVSGTLQKLLGFDYYFSDDVNINSLNEKGNIQMVNENISFSDGNKIVIEGLVYDGTYINLFVSNEDECGKINIDEGIPLSMYPEKVNGDKYNSVYRFFVNENLDCINLNAISKDGEVKSIKITIDKSKIVQTKILQGKNEKVSVEGIDFKVNEILISHLGVTIDYSLTSEDSNLINKLKSVNKSFYKYDIAADIFVACNIKSEKYFTLGGWSEEEIENGMRFKRLVVFSDISVDDIEKVEVTLDNLYFTKKLDSTISKNTWINDYVYFDIVEDAGDYMSVQYWTRFKHQEDGRTILEYNISPYAIFYGSSGSLEGSKEIFIEEHKNFTNFKADYEKNNLYISKNKAFNIPENKRKIVFYLRGEQ